MDYQSGPTIDGGYLLAAMRHNMVASRSVSVDVRDFVGKVESQVKRAHGSCQQRLVGQVKRAHGSCQQRLVSQVERAHGSCQQHACRTSCLPSKHAVSPFARCRICAATASLHRSHRGAWLTPHHGRPVWQRGAGAPGCLLCGPAGCIDAEREKSTTQVLRCLSVARILLLVARQSLVLDTPGTTKLSNDNLTPLAHQLVGPHHLVMYTFQRRARCSASCAFPTHAGQHQAQGGRAAFRVPGVLNWDHRVLDAPPFAGQQRGRLWLNLKDICSVSDKVWRCAEGARRKGGLGKPAHLRGPAVDCKEPHGQASFACSGSRQTLACTCHAYCGFVSCPNPF
eukprot:276078-Chlamydomonas_euryale.AAC.3